MKHMVHRTMFRYPSSGRRTCRFQPNSGEMASLDANPRKNGVRGNCGQSNAHNGSKRTFFCRMAPQGQALPHPHSLAQVGSNPTTTYEYPLHASCRCRDSPVCFSKGGSRSEVQKSYGRRPLQSILQTLKRSGQRFEACWCAGAW
jgi:hypothetical protein